MNLDFFSTKHLSPEIGVQLRRRAVDTRSVVESNLRTRPDHEIFQWATRNGYIVVTCDDDYFDLARENPEHAGLLFFEQEQYSIGQIVTRLARLHATRTAESMAGLVLHL